MYANNHFEPNRNTTQGLTWINLFTGLLDHSTLLVGSTIKCAAFPPDQLDLVKSRLLDANLSNAMTSSLPMVDTSAVAFSKDTVDLWRARGVLETPTPQIAEGLDLWSGLLSMAVIDAGYSIDSLMSEYSLIDWRQPQQWACHSLLDPTTGMFHGHELDPFEVMFVRVDGQVKKHVNTHWATTQKTVGELVTREKLRKPKVRQSSHKDPHPHRNNLRDYRDHHAAKKKSEPRVQDIELLVIKAAQKLPHVAASRVQMQSRLREDLRITGPQVKAITSQVGRQIGIYHLHQAKIDNLKTVAQLVHYLVVEFKLHTSPRRRLASGTEPSGPAPPATATAPSPSWMSRWKWSFSLW